MNSDLIKTFLRSKIIDQYFRVKCVPTFRNLTLNLAMTKLKTSNWIFFETSTCFSNIVVSTLRVLKVHINLFSSYGTCDLKRDEMAHSRGFLDICCSCSAQFRKRIGKFYEYLFLAKVSVRVLQSVTIFTGWLVPIKSPDLQRAYCQLRFSNQSYGNEIQQS